MFARTSFLHYLYCYSWVFFHCGQERNLSWVFPNMQYQGFFHQLDVIYDYRAMQRKQKYIRNFSTFKSSVQLSNMNYLPMNNEYNTHGKLPNRSQIKGSYRLADDHCWRVLYGSEPRSGRCPRTGKPQGTEVKIMDILRFW